MAKGFKEAGGGFPQRRNEAIAATVGANAGPGVEEVHVPQNAPDSVPDEHRPQPKGLPASTPITVRIARRGS
jgi:hypothetical protein